MHPLSERKRGKREGTRKRKFFESLRPAQKKSAYAVRRRAGRNHPGETSGMDIEAEPEIQKTKFEYNNTTTKSLILAQDER